MIVKLNLNSLNACCESWIDGMTVIVQDEKGTSEENQLIHEADKRDYLITIAKRINQVKIQGGNNEHPLQLVEVKVRGGGYIVFLSYSSSRKRELETVIPYLFSHNILITGIVYYTCNTINNQFSSYTSSHMNRLEITEFGQQSDPSAQFHNPECITRFL